MSRFDFATDAQGEEFCEKIAAEMVSLFGISADEAVGRINKQWRNVKLLGREHVIYHEEEIFWAKDIYYGHDSFWWKGESGITPQSYP